MARYSARTAPSPIVEDVEIYPRLVELGGCLETELAAAGIEATTVISPEGEVALDYCGSDNCSAQAWVRIVTASPYDAFPDIPEGPVSCSLLIAYVLEVGVAHCAPQQHGMSPPSVSEQLEAVRVQTAAMSAMLRAIRCCANADTDVPWSLGEYQPGLNEGGCLAGWWTVTVGDIREA